MGGWIVTEGKYVDRIIIAVVVVAMVFAVLILSFGCASTPVVKYERVEVPKPYWSPPSNVAALPDEPSYGIPHLTLDEAEADPNAALVKIIQDLTACLGDDAHVRFLYERLVELITEAPAPPPTPPE